MFVHIAAAATLYMLKRPVRGGECGPAAETYSVQVPKTSSLGAYVRCVYSSSELSCLLAKFLHTWGEGYIFSFSRRGQCSVVRMHVEPRPVVCKDMVLKIRPNGGEMWDKAFSVHVCC